MTVLGSALALPDGRDVMLYRATAADTEKCAVRRDSWSSNGEPS